MLHYGQLFDQLFKQSWFSGMRSRLLFRRHWFNWQKNWQKNLLLFSMTLCLTAACGSPVQQASAPTSTPDTAADCRLIQHDAGEASVCGQPQKVVALSMHMLDILLSLDQQPAGYAPVDPLNQPKFTNPAAQIPYLGDYITTEPVNVGSRSDPSLETLVNLKPDLILGELGFNRDEYDLLSRLAPTTLFGGARKEEWQRSLEAIAQALGKPEQATQVIAEYNQQLAQTRTDLAPVVAQYPNLLLLGSGDLRERVQVRNGSDFTGGLLEDLGFQLVFPDRLTDMEGGEVQISLEALSRSDADLIIVQAWNDAPNSPLEKVKQEWQQIPILQSMPANQQGRVYFVDYQLWSVSRGAIAAQLIFDQLRQLLLDSSN